MNGVYMVSGSDDLNWIGSFLESDSLMTRLYGEVDLATLAVSFFGSNSQNLRENSATNWGK